MTTSARDPESISAVFGMDFMAIVVIAIALGYHQSHVGAGWSKLGLVAAVVYMLVAYAVSLRTAFRLWNLPIFVLSTVERGLLLVWFFSGRHETSSSGGPLFFAAIYAATTAAMAASAVGCMLVFRLRRARVDA